MKKGFTLIELLAVIVILAIIAVIAVPIVINIIDESKENATLRSAEMYMDAVELAVADRVMHHGAIPNKAYPIMSDGNICLVELTNNTCTKDDTLEVEVKGEKPTSGQIIIKDGQIEKESNATEKTWLEISEKRIEPIEENGEVKFGIVNSENSKEEKIEVGKFSSVCKPAEGTEYNTTPGTKYICEVKEGTSYTFYVLNSTSTEVNLIMDRNICEDGTAASSTNTCLVAWYASSDYNSIGPVTAMTYLYNATKDWNNVGPLNYEYKDKIFQGTTSTNTSYTSFVSSNGEAAIKALEETIIKAIGTSDKPLRARMPIYTNNSINISKNEVANFSDKKFLYENLACEDYSAEGGPDYCVDGVNHIDGIKGYWTLSSHSGSYYPSWYVSFIGEVSATLTSDVSRCGVRAVINLKF